LYLFIITTDFDTDTSRAYGKVYKAKHKETDFLMAIKCINLDGISQQESRQLMKEIDVLKTCRSTHIVSYFSSCFRKNCLWVRPSPPADVTVR
jgi:serine/threonine protein kinase